MPGKFKALALGATAVVCFSFTLPATRLAVPAFGAVTVGLGRALVAAILAAVFLIVRREPFPRRYVGQLLLVGLGIAIGFPLCTSIALRSVPSVHAAVIVGFLPAVTAVFATLRGREKPSAAFWMSAAVGVVLVILFAVVQGAGSVRAMDGFLLLGVLLASYGYAEGAVLARDLGGPQVISWALVLASPLVAIPVAAEALIHGGVHGQPSAWLGLGYVSVVSMYLAFFAWYPALALGGIARIGQLQLAQAPLTLIWGALLLHERVTWLTAASACLIVATAAWTQRMKVAPPTLRHVSEPGPVRYPVYWR